MANLTIVTCGPVPTCYDDVAGNGGKVRKQQVGPLLSPLSSLLPSPLTLARARHKTDPTLLRSPLLPPVTWSILQQTQFSVNSQVLFRWLSVVTVNKINCSLWMEITGNIVWVVTIEYWFNTEIIPIRKPFQFLSPEKLFPFLYPVVHFQ